MMARDGIDLTGEQIRAARALLRIDQRRLAAEAKLSLETVKRLEAIRGTVDANARTLRALRSAFFRLGAVFDDHAEVHALVGVLREGPSLHDAQGGDGSDRGSSAGGDAGVSRLIYYSTADESLCGDREGERVLSQIAALSKVNNRRDDITGALVFCGRHFLQVLEGREEAVQAAFDRIRRDRRHHDVRLLQLKPAQRRLFNGWSMVTGRLSELDAVIVEDLHMPDGFHPEHLTPAEALGLLVLAVLAQHRAPSKGGKPPSSAAPRRPGGAGSPQLHT